MSFSSHPTTAPSTGKPNQTSARSLPGSDTIVLPSRGAMSAMNRLSATHAIAVDVIIASTAPRAKHC